LTSRFSIDERDVLRVVWEDGNRVFCRGWCRDADGNRSAVLVVRPIAEHPSAPSLDRLAREYELRDELDGAWAVRPLELQRDAGPHRLLLEDPGGEPLQDQLGAPIDVESVLHLAIRMAAVLGKVHQRGLVHKDIKPHNIIVNRVTGEIKLTGFGIASRLLRERQSPEPPETIAGTLAYMAPEQTGRMNRSIDSRSDLYALGVTLYQMLTGQLPFTASDATEWVHCHVARQPVPPAERQKDVPGVVSMIIMKLLSKTAEDRYQTAGGLERDLRRCLAEWKAQHRIDDFVLGEHDTPDRLVVPEKLYGREREVTALLAAFNRVVNGGAPELVLVSGYSGIGKSSVVSELHKALVQPGGLFASGKFDQYKRDIPYATLAQAFQGLIRPLLGKSDADLGPWRDALRGALGPNGQLMVELVPELKLIIGEQPPVAELPPQDAQRRFQLVFRRFIGVFARPEHPLVLFLDDLQWLDLATLDLFEDLLTRSGLQHLALIGAYRDNEVTAVHPLVRKLDSIKGAGGKVGEITLAPLAREHLEQLVADALRCDSESASPLVQLIHGKTGGNPFFAIQFMSSLAQEGMLTFDHDTARWSWDLDRIDAKGYTDNVVDLLVGKLARLPGGTQNALQHLACLGNIAETTTLSIVLGTPEEQLHAALWPALREELVERRAAAYRFVHDRVQEAAYSLIPQSLRAEAHLRIGRLLAAQGPFETREEMIFDVVNQLNRGAALITLLDEREQLAELNLLAGKRAKASTAYASALAYLAAGAALLSKDSFERRHDLAFALELKRAECEFLTGALVVAEERLASLATRVAKTVERALVACLQMDLYTTLGQGSSAIAIGLDYLKHLDVDWSPHPTDQDVKREYERIWSQLGSRAIEDLIDLPLMTDPASLATLDVLTRLGPSTLSTDANLFSLTICRAVNLSLEQGNSDGSCYAYVRLGTIAGAKFSDYEAGYRFGQLGYDLVEGRGLKRFQARTYLTFGNVILPLSKHVRAGRSLMGRAFETANQTGDLTFAGYSCILLNNNMLAAGDPLSEVQRETEHGLAFGQNARFGIVIDTAATQLALVRTLRGLTPTFGSLDDEQFDELQMESRFSCNPNLAIAECWYWVCKLQARFLAQDYEGALAASSKAQGLLWTSPSLFETADYHLYSALSRAAACEALAADQQAQHVKALVAHHRQLEVWAETCPENFESRAALVGAEIARIEGRELDAERLYEQAIRAARENGFIHNEAIAYELAARFYGVRRFGDFAHLYLRKARDGYLGWGADGKVWQLESLYPQIKETKGAPAPTGTIGTPVEHLDLATVIKLSQVVSGEIVLEKMLDKLMRAAVEHAGAERGVLVLSSGGEQRIRAEATTQGDTIIVQLRDETVSGEVLPDSVLRYVIRTRESVILDDAGVEPSIAKDPYVRRRQARSILCLPLINQARLIGVLYLENNLAARVFAPARLTVLKLLASQAAISLENTQLYRDLAEREAKIRHLVDANIIGIFIWKIEGQVIEANDAFLQMVGYDREDLVSGRVNRTDLTPPEWRERDALITAELKASGAAQPFEKEYVRKDGTRIQVMIGVTAFDEKLDQGVGFVLDLTEQRRAEAHARESERRYREIQLDLAHANRVAAMGQLTASIAHEIRQPLAAVKMDGATGLRWLTRTPPEINEAKSCFENIVKDANRAANVISRVHSLVKKATPSKDTLDLNEAILEVVALTRSEAAKHGANVQIELANNLPRIFGDRVRLQQVMINLIVNAIQAVCDIVPDVREVHISTAYRGSEEVLVAVRDTGPGLSAESLPHLFEPFYTTKPDGMGMGLSICRSIIEDHGGQLSASANVPRGAVFQFTLPSNRESAG